ncbi:MAG: peptidyl-prolyl cis-trans isomerase [Wenzhouxiangella sp.]|nr:MAG: peptidyl-prolyl cis-trans isomerase [Wenzhouxiangella sp.]
MNGKVLVLLISISAMVAFLSACQPAPSDPLIDPEDVILVEVDGRAVSLPMLEYMMVQRGIDEDDHEGMRELLDELIRLRAVANAAERDGLAEQAEVRAQRALRDMETLQLRYFSRIHEEYPVTDEDIQAVYEAQLQRSGDRQFRLETIAYPSQRQALLAIASLEDGETDFAALSEQARRDGLTVEPTGWVDRSQVGDELGPLFAEAEAGDVLSAPLQTPQGWRLVRIADERPLQAPALDDVREGIARQLVRQRLEALVEDLYDAAEITPMLPLEEASAD